MKQNKVDEHFFIRIKVDGELTKLTLNINSVARGADMNPERNCPRPDI